MKFNFFHLAPYPYLPEDWDEDHETMSLDFPNGHFDPQDRPRALPPLPRRARVRRVGRLRRHRVNEHHQTAYGIMPSPNIMAAALARRTSRAKIMVLGNAIPIRGNPLRVAEEIAMLDHLTDGRLVSGFVRGIGWEYFAHSISPTRSRSRFDEAHDLIIKAWTSTEPFQWIGENYEYRYVNIWPRPLQQPHPPIVMAGAGSLETMRWCAEHRHTFMAVISRTETIKAWFDSFRGYAARRLRARSRADGLGRARSTSARPTRRPSRRPAGRSSGTSRSRCASRRAPASARLHVDRVAAHRPDEGAHPLLRPLDRGAHRGGYIIVGSPSTVAERIHELQETLGFGQLGANIPVGTVSQQQTRESTDAFAKEVIPLFREKTAPVAT